MRKVIEADANQIEPESARNLKLASGPRPGRSPAGAQADQHRPGRADEKAERDAAGTGVQHGHQEYAGGDDLRGFPRSA